LGVMSSPGRGVFYKIYFGAHQKEKLRDLGLLPGDIIV